MLTINDYSKVVFLNKYFKKNLEKDQAKAELVLTINEKLQTLFTANLDKDYLLSFKNLYGTDHCFSKSPVINAEDGDNTAISLIENYVSVRKISNNVTMDTALKLINELYSDKLYGVLLVNLEQGLHINPLHPNFALVISEFYKEFYIDTIPFEFYVYEYTKPYECLGDLTLDECEKFYNKIEHFYHTRTKYIKSSNTDPLEAREYDLRYYLIDPRAMLFRHRHTRAEYFGPKDDYVSFIPNTLLNDKILYPFYGVSAVDLRSGDGINLTPFLSVNVENFDDALEIRRDEYHEYFNDFYNVCIGNYTQDFEGYLSLNHCNTESKYHGAYLSHGFITFAKASIKKALSIYKNKGII